MANNSSTTPSRPRLLAHPAELRNQIYSLVLIAPDHQLITIRRDLHEPPLLQICRQVRRESADIYYGENTFKAGESLYCAHKRHGHGTLTVHRLLTKPEAGANSATLFAWLHCIGKPRASFIKRLVLEHEDVARQSD